ncbi:MAG: hypothetical protein DDT42_01532 [candidate division WS2 bacterium]|uniref:Uncharacterized protein n=1 Tax=Psychracetigena formicireducens TaxID=2986056 RepID=A0A9E2BIR5_PSYF1|nr:hypothetical protein [Candidatus Psychracetigena formicireducens]
MTEQKTSPFLHDSAETLGFLASPFRARSYNKRVSGYGATHLRPNLPFGQTSDTRKPLYEITALLSDP